jgi:hypothetical protein
VCDWHGAALLLCGFGGDRHLNVSIPVCYPRLTVNPDRFPLELLNWPAKALAIEPLEMQNSIAGPMNGLAG